MAESALSGPRHHTIREPARVANPPATNVGTVRHANNPLPVYDYE
jgi:hypothetical protein